MNAHLAPVDLQSSYADVSALLKILADPAAHKARLDELIAQENSTKEQIAALNAMAADTRRLHSAAEATNIVANRKATALDTRETELDTRAQALELTEATRSHKSLQRREAAVQAREDAVAREEKRLAALMADHNAKAGKLKDFAGTLAG
jgi:hypothetical protein